MDLFFTIISGVFVFVISQFCLKLVIEPVVALKSTFGEISALFLREQRKITNASATAEVQEKIWALSASLLATSTAIPYYKKLSCFINLPTEKSISQACGSLNVIAYGIVKKDKANIEEIIKNMSTIAKKLNIKTEYGQKS